MQYRCCPQEGAHRRPSRLNSEAAPYRFEVAVDDLLPVQHLQAAQQGVGEPPDQRQAEALEVVFFDQLIKVHPVRRDKAGFIRLLKNIHRIY